jgi:hypothetical protein
MRTATICSALTAFLAFSLVRAQAVELTMLTLACTGTMEGVGGIFRCIRASSSISGAGRSWAPLNTARRSTRDNRLE